MQRRDPVDDRRNTPEVARRASAPAARRRDRERVILEATRALIDAKGFRQANIDDIAKAVGVNRAVIYRHFSGKEELFALTLVGYIEQLDQRLLAADDDETKPPADRLRALSETFVDFGIEYPACLDCALALLQRPARALFDEVSEGAMLRLGRAMATGLARLALVLREGMHQGVFAIDDPDFMANLLCTQSIGMLHLARSGAIVKEAAPGVPTVVSVPTQRVRDAVVNAAVSLATGAHLMGGAPAASIQPSPLGGRS